VVNDFNIITRNTEGEVCHTRIESIDVKIKDVEGNEVEKKGFDEQSGKYRVSYKARSAAPYLILVSIGGEPIKNSPHNVNTRDVKTEFKPVKTFGKEGHRKGQFEVPQSIALSDNGEIAIADCNNHRIQIFSLGGKYLREFGSKGTEDEKLYEPCGVVFVEDRIIVSDGPDGKGRVKEFDLNGTYVRTIYRRTEQWFNPTGMCVNDDKNIAVCCWGNEELGIKPSIKLFSKQGHLIHEFYMTDNNEYEEYMFITYGNGKYFVPCFDKDCIGVFDENGVFLYKFGGEGERDGQFYGIGGLAVYGPDMILVCDMGNHRVQLLTQEGQFIKSFVSRGSGVGQMNYPTDVVVTADGQVFVIDFCGNRVHVWC
jgi:tripartite motif-containing protein 2/3